MSETPKRLRPTFETFRELFLKSGNLCAFPGCDALMMNEDGIFIGQLCHIQAAESGGERFNPSMTNEERRSVSNLMLMCYPHHRETNDATKYTVADLKKMKAAHERRFSRANRVVREKAARLNRTALVSAGLVAGVSLGGIVRQIRSALDALIRRPEQPSGEPRSLRTELEHGLRYAPTGKIYYYSRDPLHLAVGEVFLEIFKSVGWRVYKLNEPPPGSESAEGPDFDHSMLIMFALQNSYQVPIGRQAIDELFRKCGFVSGRDHDEAIRQEGDRLIRFYTPVGVDPSPRA